MQWISFFLEYFGFFRSHDSNLGVNGSKCEIRGSVGFGHAKNGLWKVADNTKDIARVVIEESYLICSRACSHDNIILVAELGRVNERCWRRSWEAGGLSWFLHFWGRLVFLILFLVHDIFSRAWSTPRSVKFFLVHLLFTVGSRTLPRDVSELFILSQIPKF